MEPAINVSKIILSDGHLQWISQKFGAVEDLKTSLPTAWIWYKVNLQNQSKIALKVIQIDSKKYLDKFVELSEKLLGLSHKSLLKIYAMDYLSQAEDKHLVTLGFQIGDESLKTYLTHSLKLEVKTILCVVHSATLLLEKVKSSYGLHHGNIKSTNFIKVGSFFKLSEFGDGEDIQKAIAAKNLKLCTKLIDGQDFQNSLDALQNEYLSPEIRNNRCLSEDEKEEKNELFANDVYSLGIVLLEMFGNPVQKLREISTTSTEYLDQIKAYKQVVQSQAGIPLRELVNNMLEIDPSQRIKFEMLPEQLIVCSQKIGLNIEQDLQDIIISENLDVDGGNKFMNHIQFLNKRVLEAQNLLNNHKSSEALAILEAHLLEIEKSNGFEEKKAQNQYLQSICLLDMGQIQKAMELCEIALALYDGLFGKENVSSADLRFHLVACYSQLGDKQKALESVSKSLEITKVIRGELNHTYANMLAIKGLYHNEKAEFTQTLKDLALSREIYAKLYGEKSIQVANTLGTTAIVHKTMKNYQEALDYTQKACEIYLNQKRVNLDTLYKLNLNLRGVQSLMGKFSEAIKNLLKAVEIGEKIYGPDSLKLCSALSNLGSAYMNTKEFTKASKYLERGLEIRKKCLPPDSPLTAISLRNVGSLYFKTGRVSEAKEMFKQTQEIRMKKLGDNHPDTASVNYDLVTCFHKEKDFKKAVEYYNQAIDVSKKYFKADNLELKNMIQQREKAIAGKDFSDVSGSGCNIF